MKITQEIIDKEESMEWEDKMMFFIPVNGYDKKIKALREAVI